MRTPVRLMSSMLILLLAWTASLAAANTHLFRPMAKPAGCHQHEAPLPDPGPTSYACCQGGHDTALLTSVASTPPLVSCVDSVPDILAVNMQLKTPAASWVRASVGDPPELVSLRI